MCIVKEKASQGILCIKKHFRVSILIDITIYFTFVFAVV